MRAPEDDSVEILACAGAPREAREVMRVVRRCVDQGLALHEIGVVTRGGDGVPRIDEALRTFRRAAELGEDDIPAYIHGGRSLLETREARSFVLLLKVLESGLSRRDLCEWLHHAGHARAVAFEKVARQAGIVGGGGGGGAAEWNRRLDELLGTLEQSERSLAAALDGDERSAERLQQVSWRIDTVRALRKLLDRLEHARTRLAAPGQVSTAADVACSLFEEVTPRRGIQSVVDAVRSLGDLDALGVAVKLETFRPLVETALTGESVRAEKFEQGLFVGTLLPARGVPFRVVIAPGMLDGAFPRGARQDPILLDRERSAINESALGGNAVGLPRASRSLEEDRLLFRLLCAAARDKLVLLFPSTDAKDGRPRVPSSFVVGTVEILAGKQLEESDWPQQHWWRKIAIAGGDERPCLDLREFDRQHIERAVADVDPSRVRFLESVEPRFGRALQAEIARFGSSEFTPWDGMVPGEVAGLLPAGPDKKAMSPSGLQDYASCPFTFYAKRVLGLRVDQDPAQIDSISPLHRGLLIHGILEEFVAGIRDQVPLARERVAEFRQRLLEIAERHMSRFESEGLTGYPVLWSVERERVQEDLDVFLRGEFERREGFVPGLLEAAFGVGEGVDPLVIELADHTVKVRGHIDRVDLNESDAANRKAIVIDYKTGKSERYDAASAGVDGGRHLQLPLYAWAVEQVLKPGITVERAVYEFCTVKEDGKAISVNRATLQSGRGELLRVLSGIAQGIRSGVFLADPRQESQCRNCDFRLVCGKGAGLEVRFERKQGDPAAKLYFDL